MQTVTQAFQDALVKPDLHVVRQVSYKRRYWTGSAYVWESSWTSLPETKIVSVSPITTQLDTETQNEFRIDNLTIIVQNFSNEWNPANTVGLFGVDSNSPTYGYEPYWTKFRVSCGLVKTDGTTETIPKFTGLATEFTFNSNDGSAQISVTGEQAFLSGANAEAVSTTVTNEAVGTGNASNKIFTTAHNGVGIIKSVALNGTVKAAGVDYTLSNLNDPNNPATITFAAAPGGGVAVTATYLYWQQSKKVEELVTSLLNVTQAAAVVGSRFSSYVNPTAGGVHTGDGVHNTGFTSDNNVIAISSVVVVPGSITLTPLTDYNVSQLNDPNNPAIITFTPALANGTDAYATYTYNTLPTMQTITPVTFPNLVTNQHLYSTQSDWEAGSITNESTKDGTNALKALAAFDANFATGSVTGSASHVTGLVSLTPPADPTYMNGYLNGNYSGSVEQSVDHYVSIARQLPAPSGTFQNAVIGQYHSSDPSDVWGVRMRADNSGVPGTLLATFTTSLPYNPSGTTTINISAWGNTGGYWLELYRVSGTGWIDTLLRSPDSAGCTTIGSTTTTVGSQSWLDLWDGLGFRDNAHKIDYGMYFTYASYTLSGVYTSASYDTFCGSISTAVTLIQSANIPTGTSITTYVDGSNDNSTWDVTYSASNLNGSTGLTVANRRYWRIRVSMSTTGANRNLPSVYSCRVSFGSTATWISASLDMGSAPSLFGALAPVETLNGGTEAFYTATSADNTNWDAFVPVASLVPQSTARRYIKIKVVQTLNTGGTAGPVLSSLTFVYYTSTVTVTLANFTGMTVYDAISQLARLANYEFGFDEKEDFFFRPRTKGSPALALARSTNVMAVLSSSIGYDRLTSDVRAVYGSYTNDTSDAGGYQSPSARVGYALYQAPSTSLAISADANLAAGVSQTLFNYYKTPRRRVKVQIKFTPQLQLGDVVSLDYADNLPSPVWYWGDPDVYWGDPAIYYYSGLQQLYYQLAVKVVGIRLDTDSWTSELDLEEAL